MKSKEIFAGLESNRQKKLRVGEVGLDLWFLTRCKHFNAVYKTNKIDIDVYCTTEISMHAEFSHCLQNWYYGLQAMYSGIAIDGL